MITISPHASEQIHHQVSKKNLTRLFGQVLPDSSILTEKEQLVPYECDGLSAYQCTPWIVVLPETVEQVQQIMKICYQQGVPVVARGAGTGLSGGAIPLENGVLLVLAKFKQILQIDTKNRIAIVQPGVRNLAIPDQIVWSGVA